jgi:organic radical activating enzyme
MAAVAGSKGKLELQTSGASNPQLSLIKGLLAGEMSAGQAVHALLDAARLREVGIDTNMICNLRCQYCYLTDREEQPGTVPLDRLQSSLCDLAEKGVKLFAFIGKEPLADDRAVRLLRALNNKRSAGPDFRTGMVTNGTLVDRWLDSLLEADLSYLDISIDGLGEAENRLRADVGLSGRVNRAIQSVVGTKLRDRFSTATVLTHTSAPHYRDFVDTMFSADVVTCFASPVLRFAMSNDVADQALELDEVLRLCDDLAKISAGSDRQIIIDLPYRYSWALLHSRQIQADKLQEDRFEAIYYQVAGSSLYLKINPFPYSYWRAARVTHDGQVILNMDLAAHRDYAESSVDFEGLNGAMLPRHRAAGASVLSAFVAKHQDCSLSGLFERDLERQFSFHRSIRTAA